MDLRQGEGAYYRKNGKITQGVWLADGLKE